MIYYMFRQSSNKPKSGSRPLRMIVYSCIGKTIEVRKRDISLAGISQDVLSKLTLVVAWWRVVGNDHGGTTTVTKSNTHTETARSFPDHLSEVTRFHRETGCVEVVILDFIVPRLTGFAS